MARAAAPSTPIDADAEAARDALAGRLFDSAAGAVDLAAVYMGDRLGLYRALDASGAQSSPELAARTGLQERYVREWLEQQAVTGILSVDDEPDGAIRRYALPVGHREVLLDELSLAYATPTARAIAVAMRMLPQIMTAFEHGGGVSWSDYGPDLREAQAATNRPLFHNILGSEWLPAIADVHARLLADPPARIADVACGEGWSSIAMARAYPKVRVDGIDLDAPAIDQARRNAATTDVADRVSYHARDAADPALQGAFDLVTIFEAVHDLSQPVAVLGACRGLLAPGGTMLVADERVSETFTAPGDFVERMMYGYSLTVCLTNGLAEAPSVGTGTVMRPATLERYALAAGFSRVSGLPIEHETFRIYRLDP
ncbi:MAG: class I SAM-dependent methyltransferase [Candidatus Limnocylindrales bacterium]